MSVKSEAMIFFFFLESNLIECMYYFRGAKGNVRFFFKRAFSMEGKNCTLGKVKKYSKYVYKELEINIERYFNGIVNNI